MPGVGIGVYPGYNPGLHEGEEVSSTYEGRHITVLEQNLIHPNHLAAGLNLVQKGDPVIICNTVALGGSANYGHAVGVALATATAITDLIAVDTEGIWLLPASSYTDGAAGSAIVAGDPLFIHDESLAAAGALGLGDALISKIRNAATQIPFGYALGTMVAAGTGTIAVKVHWDPMHDLEVGMRRTVTSGSYGWSFRGTLTDGASDGIGGYVEGVVAGTPTGDNYAFGAWLELAAGAVLGVGDYRGLDVGIYDAGAAASVGAVITGICISTYVALATNPNLHVMMRFNTDQAGDVPDYWFFAANPESVAHVVNVLEPANKTGSIAVQIAGLGARYIRLYAAA